MKLLIKSLALALFLAEADAYKLYQRQVQRSRDGESDEIDPDDQDINDGPVEDESDLVTYQQEFLNNGKNVRSLNKFVQVQKQRNDEKDGEEEVDNYANYVAPLKSTQKKEKASMLYQAPSTPPPPHPVRFIEATTSAEAKAKSRELEIEPSNVRENTMLWANARASEEDLPPIRESIEVGEIETGNLNIQ